MARPSRSEGVPGGRLSPSRFMARLAGAAPVLRRLPVGVFLAACALQLWTACNKKEAAGADPDVAAGRGIYMARCISCHNPNPAQDGSLGPAITGSSLELLQARVLRGDYPPGYKPKRDTKIMVKLPLMEEDVAKIHKYLNAP